MCSVSIKYWHLDNTMQQGHIYICRTAHCIETKKNIFKAGRTTTGFSKSNPDILKRIFQYPKGTEQLAVFYTSHTSQAEHHVLNELANDFRRCTDFGREYFEGDFDTIRSYVESSLAAYVPYLVPREVSDTNEYQSIIPN